jgi:hypothetical protein
MSDMFKRPEPRDQFKRALRAQLMAQAPGVLARRETTWTRFTGGGLMRPAMVAAAVTLIVVGGTGKAAADSLPGDIVYPLKVAAEQVQLALAIDDTTRLRILSEQADHRLAELAEAVSARPNSAPAAEQAYATAVKTLTVAVEAVRDQPNVSQDKKTAAEDVVDAAHQKHEAVLDDLKNKVSPPQQPEVDRAKQESDKLHPSGRPARTLEPSNAPERTRTPQPTKTVAPSRSPEQQNGGDQQNQPTRSPQPARTAEPTRTPNQQGEHSDTPAPSVRR